MFLSFLHYIVPFLKFSNHSLTSTDGSVKTKRFFHVSRPRNRMMKTVGGGRNLHHDFRSEIMEMSELWVGWGWKAFMVGAFPKALKKLVALNFTLWWGWGILGCVCVCVRGDYFIRTEPSLCINGQTKQRTGGWGKQSMPPASLGGSFGPRSSVKPLLCDLACTFFPFWKYETTCKWGVRACACAIKFEGTHFSCDSYYQHWIKQRKKGGFHLYFLPGEERRALLGQFSPSIPLPVFTGNALDRTAVAAAVSHSLWIHSAFFLSNLIHFFPLKDEIEKLRLSLQHSIFFVLKKKFWFYFLARLYGLFVKNTFWVCFPSGRGTLLQKLILKDQNCFPHFHSTDWSQLQNCGPSLFSDKILMIKSNLIKVQLSKTAQNHWSGLQIQGNKTGWSWLKTNNRSCFASVFQAGNLRQSKPMVHDGWKHHCRTERTFYSGQVQFLFVMYSWDIHHSCCAGSSRLVQQQQQRGEARHRFQETEH